MSENTTRNFADLGLPESLLQSLSHLGYQEATPIQQGTIPALLDGQDVVGIAQTGTGKTAAFALPILADIDLNLRSPQALVLCPTRELSIQVAEAFRSYAANMRGLRVLTVCGGADMRKQLQALKEGVHIVVATPGRMIDHLNRGSADFNNINSVVLDEADEMLRMGFIDDVDTILSRTPQQRRVALFSATMPPRIRQIAERHLKSPQEVAVAQASSTNDNIEQFFWFAKGASKIEALNRLLAYEDSDAVIVFTRTRESTAAVAEQLRKQGHKAAPLNGDMDQKSRVRAVEQLKSGSLDILVATDVAARGLDVNRITHVINFDIPFDEEAYVHRIGRTGRAGRTGKAILFVTPRERRMLRNIERLTQKPITELKLPTRGAIDRKRQAAFVSKIETQLTETVAPDLEALVDQLHNDKGADYRAIALALATLLSDGADQPMVSSAATPYSDRADAEPRERASKKPTGKKDVSEGQIRKRAVQSGESTGRSLGKARPLKEHPEIAMERFLLQIGRRHGVKPGEIMGAVANEAGIEGEFIGAIQIHDDVSTIDLPEGMPKQILKHLKKTQIKGVKLDVSRIV